MFTGEHAGENFTTSTPPTPEFGGVSPGSQQIGVDANGNPIYGGFGSASDQTDRYRNIADAVSNRAAPTTDYSAGDQYVNQGIASRALQAGALSTIRDRAVGGGPSAATLQGNQNINATVGSQLGALAGNRPNMGQIIGGGAGAIGAGMQQVGAARNAELASAQSNLNAGFNNMRENDLTGMKMQDARSQYLANAIMNQRAMNQHAGLGFEGLGENVRTSTLASDIANANRNLLRVQGQTGIDTASSNNANDTARTIASGGTTGLGQVFAHYGSK